MTQPLSRVTVGDLLQAVSQHPLEAAVAAVRLAHGYGIRLLEEEPKGDVQVLDVPLVGADAEDVVPAKAADIRRLVEAFGLAAHRLLAELTRGNYSPAEIVRMREESSERLTCDDLEVLWDVLGCERGSQPRGNLIRLPER